MSRSVVVAFVIIAASLAAGCEAEQCVKMRQCCAEIATQEWVGDACGAIASDLYEPQACSAVVDAIRVAAEDNDTELPQVCQ